MKSTAKTTASFPKSNPRPTCFLHRKLVPGLTLQYVVLWPSANHLFFLNSSSYLLFKSLLSEKLTKCWLLCETFSDLVFPPCSPIFFPLHHLVDSKDTFWLLNSLSILLPFFSVILNHFCIYFVLFLVWVKDVKVVQGKK